MMSTPPSRSILQMLKDELDTQLGKLMDIKRYKTKFPSEDIHELAKSEQRGHCLGLAKAVAIMENPYDPDIDRVRREAMERFNAKTTA